MPDLMVKINGDTSGLDAATGKAKSSIASFSGIDIPLPGIGQITAVVGGIAALGKVTLDTVQAGKDAAAAQAEFQRSLEASGAATAGWQEKTDAAIASAQEKAFSDDEAMKALATLAKSTGNVDAAIALLPVSMDLARQGNTDLANSADAMTDAMAGADGKLLKMMDGLAKGETAAETLNNAFKASKGAADTWAESGEAAGIKFQMMMSEAMEFVGTELLPAFEELGKALDPLMQAFQKFLQMIWPPVKTALMALIQFITTIIGWVNKAVTAMTELWTKIDNLIQPIKDLIAEIGKINLNPLEALNGFDFNPFNTVLHGVTQQAGASQFGTVSQPAPVNMTFNISGDPAIIEARVNAALRNYTRRNGPGSVFSPGRR